MMHFQPITYQETGEFQYATIENILVILGNKNFYSLIPMSFGQKKFKDFIKTFINDNKLKSNYIFVFFYNSDSPDLKYGNVEFWAFTYEKSPISSCVKIEKEKEESRVVISEVGELFNEVKNWLADSSSSIESEIVDNIEDSFKQFMHINSNNPNDILS